MGAFELAVKRGIPCTVVDPRCPGNCSDAGDHSYIGPWAGWHFSRPQRVWLETHYAGVRGLAACQAYVESCTFADEFPNRRLDDGRPVRDFEDLVLWLQEHHPASKTGFLGFQGANLAVY